MNITDEVHSRLDAFARIRRRILTGFDDDGNPDKLFVFGEKTSERDIAEALGCSRTPVREALTVLAYNGLLERRPQSGILLRKASPADVYRAIRVSKRLETIAVADLAEVVDGKLRGKAIDTLNQILSRASQEIEPNEAGAAGQFEWYDTEFHVSLAALAGYDGGASSIQASRDRIQLYRREQRQSISRQHCRELNSHNQVINNALTASAKNTALHRIEEYYEAFIGSLLPTDEAADRPPAGQVSRRPRFRTAAG